MNDTMRDAARLEASALYESEDTYNHPEEVMAKAFERGAAWQAAQIQPAPPVPASVQEIMRLMNPYLGACITMMNARHEEIEEAGKAASKTLATLQAALTALVEDNHRLKFELDGVNAMREVAPQPPDGQQDRGAAHWCAHCMGVGPESCQYNHQDTGASHD